MYCTISQFAVFIGTVPHPKVQNSKMSLSPISLLVKMTSVSDSIIYFELVKDCQKTLPLSSCDFTAKHNLDCVFRSSFYDKTQH